MRLNRLTGMIKYNNSVELASFDQSYNTTLPPGSSIQAEVDVSVSLLDIGLDIFNILTGGNKLPDTRVDGILFSDGASTPYSKPVLKIG